MRFALVLAFVLSLVVACRDRTFEVEVTQPELQSRVAAKFPIRRKAFMTELALENPVVLLRSGRDDIGVELRVTIDPPGFEPRTGTLGVAGKLSYRATEKAFFLERPVIETLEVEGLPAEYRQKAVSALEAVALGALTLFPVYELKGRNAGEVSAKHLLESVTVHDGRLVATLKAPF